ncbi:MAG: prepilin-type N-terminal cleavage/methylation domain-containing protein [Planctomycetota bacterium]
MVALRRRQAACAPKSVQATAEGHDGFTLVEVTIAVAVLVVGLLGFISALSSAQVLVRGTKEVNLAHIEILNAVEDFRDTCATDYIAALTVYKPGVVANIASSAMGKNVQVTSTLVLNETLLTPPMDINGDLDFLDVAVDPAAALLAVLHVKITWSGVLGAQEIHYVSLIAKGEVQ